eukprot:jgi/Orpsp1_1/1179040/evm.model.c7180000067688.1
MLGNEQLIEENNKQLVPYSIVRIVNENKNEFENNNSLLSEGTANRISKLTNIAKSSLNTTNNITDIVIGTAKYSTSATLGFTKSLLLDILSSAQDIITKTENEQYKLNKDTDKMIEHINENNSGQTTPKMTDALQKYFSFGAYLIHQSFSLTELLTLSTFNFTSQTVKFTLKAAEETVSIIDTLFGSTETSKIIASFVEILMKEFQSMPSLEKKKEQQQRKLFLSNLTFNIIKNNPIEQIYNVGTVTKALIAYACLQHINYFHTIKYYEETDCGELDSEKQCIEDFKDSDYSSNSSSFYSDDSYYDINKNKNTIIKKLFENITEIPEMEEQINNKKSTNLILSEMEKKQLLLEETRKKINRLKTIKNNNDINNSIYYHEENNDTILLNSDDNINVKFEINNIIYNNDENNKRVQESFSDDNINGSMGSLDNDFRNIILEDYNDTNHIIEDSSMLLVKLSKNEIKEIESVNFSKGFLERVENEDSSLVESTVTTSSISNPENKNKNRNIEDNKKLFNKENNENENILNDDELSCMTFDKDNQNYFISQSNSKKNEESKINNNKNENFKTKEINNHLKFETNNNDDSVLSKIILSPILKNTDEDYDDPIHSNDSSLIKEKTILIPPHQNSSSLFIESTNEKIHKNVCFENDKNKNETNDSNKNYIILKEISNNSSNKFNNNEDEWEDLNDDDSYKKYKNKNIFNVNMIKRRNIYNRSKNNEILKEQNLSTENIFDSSINNNQKSNIIYSINSSNNATNITNNNIKEIIKIDNSVLQNSSIFKKDNVNNELSIYQNKSNINPDSYFEINKSTYLNIPYIPSGRYITSKRYQCHYTSRKFSSRRRYRHRNNNVSEIVKSRKLKINDKVSRNCNKSLLLSSDNKSYSLMNQFINPRKYYPLPNFLNNIYRYSKFVSASYGKTFMQVMKIGIVDSLYTEDSEYPENHYAFSIHTK